MPAARRDLLEPALGLRHEELRERDVVVVEPPEPHLVELDEPPGASPDAKRKHQQGVHAELAEDERLRRIDLLLEERDGPRLADAQRLGGERKVRDPVRGLLAE